MTQNTMTDNELLKWCLSTRQKLADKGLKNKDLAKALNRSPAYISWILSGYMRSNETIQEIDSLLDTYIVVNNEEKKKHTTIRIPIHVYNYLKKEAENKNISLNALIANILQECFKEKNNQVIIKEAN